MLNANATTPATENEDGFWEDGFPVNTDRERLEHAAAVCNVGIKNRKPYEPETCEDFAKGPTHGIGLKVRRKRMGSTWDITKHYLAEFGRFGGMVTVPDADGAIRERWIVFIQDLLGGVYGFAEYTSAEELHKVWELD